MPALRAGSHETDLAPGPSGSTRKGRARSSATDDRRIGAPHLVITRGWVTRRLRINPAAGGLLPAGGANGMRHVGDHS